MNNKVKSKNNAKDNVKEIALSAVVLLIYFYHMDLNDSIINQPVWINYTLFLIIDLALSISNFNKLKISIKTLIGISLYYNIALYLFKFSIISYFLSGIMMIPFNYYNIQIANEKSLEIVNCEIKNVSTYSKNRCVFYNFKGNTNVMYGYTPVMEEIKDNGKFKDYCFIVKCRTGLFGSYIMESWRIEKK